MKMPHHKENQRINNSLPSRLQNSTSSISLFSSQNIFPGVANLGISHSLTAIQWMAAKFGTTSRSPENIKVMLKLLDSKILVFTAE